MNKKQSRINLSKKQKRLLILLLIIITNVFAFTISEFIRDGKNKEPVHEMDTKVAEIQKGDEKDYQKAINNLVEEGYMNITFVPYATFDKSGKSLSFSFENSKENRHPMQFEIFDPKGKSVYLSSKIPVGYEVKEVDFEKPLEEGIYDGYKIGIKYFDSGNVSYMSPLTIQVVGDQ